MVTKLQKSLNDRSNKKEAILTGTMTHISWIDTYKLSYLRNLKLQFVCALKFELKRGVGLNFQGPNTQNVCAYHHLSACVSMRQHTSAYVIIRKHTKTQDLCG